MSEVPVSPNPRSTAGGESESGSASTIAALIPAFALGATDADETAAVQRELGRSTEAAQALAVYGALAERMLYAAPPAAPPSSLAERLAASLTSRAGTSNAGEPVLSGVAAPVMPAAGPAVQPPPAKSARRWIWPAAAAAAALLLLASVNVYLLRANADLRTDLDLLQTTVEQQAGIIAEQEEHLAAQSGKLAEQDVVLAAMVASEGERYTMNAAQEGSQALAEVAWLFDENVAVLRASHFPSLEPGKVYQLWLIRNGERTSGGTFMVDEQGTGTFVFTPPESLDNFEGMGITPEPAGGSPGPTAPPVVRAQL